jgi:hypothetical protein
VEQGMQGHGSAFLVLGTAPAPPTEGPKRGAEKAGKILPGDQAHTSHRIAGPRLRPLPLMVQLTVRWQLSSQSQAGG